MDRIQLSGEKFEKNSQNLIKILPTFLIDNIKDIDVLVNQNSMPEIPLEASANYLQQAKREVKLFFSYNYEALTEDREFAVVTVPEVVKKVGGFKRLIRAPSWVRPGYVEEVYVTNRYTKLQTKKV